MISRTDFQMLERQEAMDLAQKSIGNTNGTQFKEVVGVDFSYGTFIKDLKYYHGINKPDRTSDFAYLEEDEWEEFKKKIDYEMTEKNKKKAIEKSYSEKTKSKEVYTFNMSGKNSKAQFSISNEVLDEFREKHPDSKGKKEQMILISIALKYFLDHEDEIDIQLKM